MRDVYLQEGFLYELNDLVSLFGFNIADNEEAKSFNKLLKLLKQKRLLKTRKIKGAIESLEDDESLISEDDYDFNDYIGTESSNKQYIFRFVGMAFYKDIIINVYPKYIKDKNRLPEKMRQVMRVIKKHQKKVYKFLVPAMLEDSEKGNEISLLSIILFLVEDYATNGVYCEMQKIREYNGSGEILWQETVDTTYPIFQNRNPIYVNTINMKTIHNQYNIFHRLHKYVLTEASLQLEKYNLTDTLGLATLELSDDELSTFGNLEYILDCLEKESAQQFNDHKLVVLKAISIYLKKKYLDVEINAISSEENFEFIGTRAFYRVWEDVIDDVYISHKNIKMGDIKSKYVPKFEYTIKLPNGSFEYIQHEQRLGQIIEKPEWYLRDETKTYHNYYPKETFIPDYLHINNSNDMFYIMDAKYYVPNWYIDKFGVGHIEKQPGVEDVVKQYMYYLVYKPLLENNGIDIKKVKNYYVMPTEGENEDVGYAKFDFLSKIITDVFDIRVKKLNAEELFSKYLSGVNDDVENIP